MDIRESTRTAAEIVAGIEKIENVAKLSQQDLVTLGEWAYNRLYVQKVRAGSRAAERVVRDNPEVVKEKYLGKAKSVAVNMFRAKLAPLLNEDMALQDGTHVLWGEATMSQLQQRYTELNLHRTGIDNAVATTALVIDAIKELGGNTLREALA